MTEEELQRWRQALRKAEEEELASIEPEPSERDAAIAEFVLARSAAAPRPRVAPYLSRRAMIGAGMLLAAGFAVALLPRRGGGSLPVYAVEIEGDSKEMAPGPTVGLPRVKSDSLFQAELRPATDLKGEIELRLYVRQGEDLLPASARFDRHGQGVLRLKLPVRDLPGSREGKQELIFVIARPGKLPSDAAVKSALRSNLLRGDTWQLLPHPILVER